MKEEIERYLWELAQKGEKRELTYLKPLSPSKVLIGGKVFLNLCSNSYLSLQYHPYVLEKTKKAIEMYGCGTCSSRSVSGSLDIFEELEARIARFKGYKKGLLFSSGYHANIGVITSLISKDDTVFSDELNHASLIDAIRLTRAKVVIYRHRDADDLERRLRAEAKKGKRFVITETVFSMDGDLAPLKELYELKGAYDLFVIVDDAHGTGVFGERGRGVEESFGVCGLFDVHIGTFGKALCSFGAFALSEPYVIDLLINKARTFMYTTAPPASFAASSLATLDLLEEDPSLRKELWQKISHMRRGLEEAGFDLGESQGPIVPLVFGDDWTCLQVHRYLFEKGVFLQAIRPPTVPKGTSRLRLTVTRAMEEDELDLVISSLKEAAARTRSRRDNL